MRRCATKYRPLLNKAIRVAKDEPKARRKSTAKRKFSMLARSQRRKWLFVAITVLPGFLLTMLFMVFPALRMFRLSLFQVSSLLGNEKFVGLANFLYMLRDSDFLHAASNTGIIIAVYTLLTLGVAMLLAVLVTQSGVRGKSFYRVVLFLPAIMSLVLIAIIFYYIYHPTFGVLNGLLDAVGLGALKRPWLGGPPIALGSLIVAMVWQGAGYYMVMYIAGLDRIPPSIYEAASLDGAGSLNRFWFITLPYLWPIVRMTMIFAIGGAINIGFLLARVLTGGTLGSGTTTLLEYIQMQAFNRANFGYSMAISVFMLLVSFGLALLANRLKKADEAP